MQELRPEAKKVYALLMNYIEIHKKIFKSSFKELSAALGLSAPVPYPVHRDNLDNILHEIDRVIKTADKSGDSLEAKTLKEYSEALKDAVSKIHRICSRLADVSTGADKSYAKKEYKQDVKEYNECVKKYKNLGWKLNEVFPNIGGP